MIGDFKKMKKTEEKITMLTAYEYIAGLLAEQSGIDIILVGDSLGMVVQGQKTPIGVGLPDVIYHAKAVRKGAKDTFLIVDMPYMTYHLSINEAKANAAEIMIKTQANAVKIEGDSAGRIDVIRALIDCEIPVCGHIGLTPQSINMYDGYTVQAKGKKEQEKLVESAIAIDAAGAFMLVLECIPEELGKKISKEISIPVIGIGAGRFTDGQVLVWHDILGLCEKTPKFVKQYLNLKKMISESIKEYVSDVKECQFPEKTNVYYPMD